MDPHHFKPLSSGAQNHTMLAIQWSWSRPARTPAPVIPESMLATALLNSAEKPSLRTICAGMECAVVLGSMS